MNLLHIPSSSQGVFLTQQMFEHILCCVPRALRQGCTLLIVPKPTQINSTFTSKLVSCKYILS